MPDRESVNVLALLLFVGLATPGQSRTTQPLYEDPFDVGAGGSSLTWAKQEGILINNPALLPYGGKIFRWLGMKNTLAVGKESLDTAKDLASSGGENSSGGEQSGAAGSNSDELMKQLFVKPLHLGFATATSFITSNGGLGVFGSLEPDLRAWKKGDPEFGAGTPNIVVRNEAYAGAYASLASRSIWRPLSFGFSAKYLLSSELLEVVELSEGSKVKELQKQIENTKNSIAPGSGMGADAGFLLFLQGQTLDLRLAGTVVNAVYTPLQGQKKAFPRTVNAGLGLTLHSKLDAIHFAADYRDYENAYGQPLYKHLYAGVRILLRTYVGLSAGLYHGSPSYGLELDLVVLRLAAAVYTREYGASPGVDQRKIYLLSVNVGSDF